MSIATEEVVPLTSFLLNAAARGHIWNRPRGSYRGPWRTKIEIGISRSFCCYSCLLLPWYLQAFYWGWWDNLIYISFSCTVHTEALFLSLIFLYRQISIPSRVIQICDIQKPQAGFLEGKQIMWIRLSVHVLVSYCSPLRSILSFLS